MSEPLLRVSEKQQQVVQQMARTERKAGAAHHQLEGLASGVDPRLRGLEGVDLAVQKLCQQTLAVQEQLDELKAVVAARQRADAAMAFAG